MKQVTVMLHGHPLTAEVPEECWTSEALPRRPESEMREDWRQIAEQQRPVREEQYEYEGDRPGMPAVISTFAVLLLFGAVFGTLFGLMLTRH